jgi:NifB/MoaA-like Fe-S oxidoreductase
MAPVFEALRGALEGATGALVEVVTVPNSVYGESVNTAGLLPGADFLRSLRARGPYDAILIPAEAINDNGIFIDDLPLAELTEALAPARVLPGHELTSTLAAL